MSMSANLHGIVRAEAIDLGSASSLHLINGDHCHVTIFMPYATAVAMADAFNNPGRMKQLTDWIADFAAADFEAIRSPGFVAPEDVEDDVTDLMTVEAWQSDAHDLINPKPATDETAE